MPSLTISAEPIANAPILALKKALEKGDVRLRTDSVLVFVCGAAVKDGDYTGDGARAQFMHHAQKHLPGFRVFLAESVINALKEAPKSELLSTEQDLACFSDCIIIIMESAGALVELGAFTARRTRWRCSSKGCHWPTIKTCRRLRSRSFLLAS